MTELSSSATFESSAQASLLSNSEEIKSIHGQFQTALRNIRRCSPGIDEIFLGDFGEEEQTVEDYLFNDKITEVQELQILIREIQNIEDDVRNLQSKLMYKKCRDKKQYEKLNKKIVNLLNLLNGQHARAKIVLRRLSKRLL